MDLFNVQKIPTKIPTPTKPKIIKEKLKYNLYPLSIPTLSNRPPSLEFSPIKNKIK